MNFQFAYIPGTSFVHRCDGRIKILLLLAYSISIFFVNVWWLMIVFALLPAVFMVIAKLPPKAVIAPLLPVIVLAAFALFFAFFNNQTLNGFLSGLFIAIRMIALVAASFVVCLTTTSSALLQAFCFFIAPLRRLHVPVDSIAFTLTLALRFIPLIAEEFSTIRSAQMSRGGDIAGQPLKRKLEIIGSAFSAMFIGLFRHADNVATAMDARCFGAGTKRTSLHSEK